MIYIEKFKFVHHRPDEYEPLRGDILKTIGRLSGDDGPPVTEDQRPGLERHLAIQMSAHVTLQIRDAYLQVITRANGWVNPWEEPDFTGFEGITDEMLLEFLREHQINQKAKRDTKRARDLAIRQAARASEKWHRPKEWVDRYRAINGRLHEVRERKNLDGEIIRDVSPHPMNSTYVRYKGERIDVVQVLRILTNKAAKRGRPSKGERFRAQVREGQKVLHLGVYDTPEERDAAVLNHRLGLGRC